MLVFEIVESLGEQVYQRWTAGKYTHIVDLLFVFVDWNPNIAPKYWMVDFNTAEMLSLENIYSHIRVFLCDFHTKQSWHRYC